MKKLSKTVSRKYHESVVDEWQRKHSLAVLDRNSAEGALADKEATLQRVQEDLRKTQERRVQLERDLFECEQALNRRFKALRAIAQMCEVGQ